MEPLLRDIPLAMLDINGKPLLQRSVETLQKCRISDVSVVTGYRNDSFKVDGVNYIHNPKYDSEHIMTSIMCAEQEIEGRTLIVYLFENLLIEKLKSIESDFVIVVDNSFDISRNNRNKNLDLVITRETLPNGDRSLNYDHLYTVERIGSEVPEHARSAEFIGITMLSAKGAEIFKEKYRQAADVFRDRSFYTAENIFQAGLVDRIPWMVTGNG